MNREGIENIKGALKIISEQCKATFSCEDCPLYDCCQGTDDLFERSPERWFQKVVQVTIRDNQ